MTTAPIFPSSSAHDPVSFSYVYDLIYAAVFFPLTILYIYIFFDSVMAATDDDDERDSVSDKLISRPFDDFGLPKMESRRAAVDEK